MRETAASASKRIPVDNFGGNPDFLPSYRFFSIDKTENSLE